MPLDEFDNTVLEAKGEARELLKRFYNIDITRSNAEKYITGIRKHLQYKQRHASAGETMADREETTIRGDGTYSIKRIILLSDADLLNPTKLMEMMGYDPLQWTLISVKTRRSSWDVTMKLRADSTKVVNKSDGTWKEANEIKEVPSKHTNYGYLVEMSVKPIQNQITTDKVREVFKNMKPPKLEEHTYRGGNKMLEFPIMDFHLGKLAWEDETGEDYNIKIAAARYKATVLDIIGRIYAYGLEIERIVFPIGQDFFHMDSTQNTTTAGTRLDSDTRWPKMYDTGVGLLIWAIEQLRAIAPVECMYVAGNHDKMLSYCATQHVYAYYHGTPSVQVDVSPRKRKYIAYGKCLIGYSHGDDESKRINLLMQQEEPKLWGDSIFREWHLAHLHHEETTEIGGIIIRRVSAITSTDEWHNTMGFVGVVQKAQAFIWDKDLGLQEILNSYQGAKT